jgi:hypothetical protein
MSDLVSGNLKEEKNTHSLELVHLGGLLHRRVTRCIDTSKTRTSDAERQIPSCTFGGNQAQLAGMK